ncbi:MAG: penicillin-binding protein 2 [Actinomycetota bacterium]|nr:penicillin-binding protein 2 [Actinomycetota bacterium]
MARRAIRAQDLRPMAVTVLLLAAWGLLGFRLFQVQAVRAEEFAGLALDQRLRRVTLAADRGTIFDREGRELAISVDAVTIYANPQETPDPDTTAALVSPLLPDAPVGRATIAGRLREARKAGSSFVYIARKLEPRQAERLLEADIPGIHHLLERKRVYPAGSLAAQVLGVVGSDNEGLEGLELRYDDTLSGSPGELLVERDPQGHIIPQGEYEAVPPNPGSDLVLTIDREIQFAAERTLAQAVRRTGAAGGSIVAMDPETGGLLAMASVPSFDPNQLEEAGPGALRNRAATDSYEPGSTQKLMTVAAALDAGAVEPETRLRVADHIQVWDKTYRDAAPHPTEVMTVADIVAHSSNVGTILIERRLGDEGFYRYLTAFGLGRPTGVDFPGELPGALAEVDEWCGPCGASTSIGYGVSVTALQMAAAFSAVANDGVWVEPHLVGEVVDGRGSRRPPELERRRVVSERTALISRLLLEGVVERGTGELARVEGYRVGGKTGTTVKYLPQYERYGEDVVASFIGMAPTEDPQVVVAVMIDSPVRDTTGGRAAAPAFAEVMLFALHQAGVPPDAP